MAKIFSFCNRVKRGFYNFKSGPSQVAQRMKGNAKWTTLEVPLGSNYPVESYGENRMWDLFSSACFSTKRRPTSVKVSPQTGAQRLTLSCFTHVHVTHIYILPLPISWNVRNGLKELAGKYIGEILSTQI